MSNDTGKTELQQSAAYAKQIVELDEGGRYIGDTGSVRLARTFLDSQLMIESAEVRMSEATAALQLLRHREQKSARERDRAWLEVLPAGWYWDNDDASRASKVDSKVFCEPCVNGTLRAIGIIPPAVRMAVNIRAMRLALENGRTVSPMPADQAPEWAYGKHDGETMEGPYLTREEAIDAGRKCGASFYVGTLVRARAGDHAPDTETVAEILDENATQEDEWSWVEGELFTIREGAAEVLSAAYDAMFESTRWRVDDNLEYFDSDGRPKGSTVGGSQNGQPATA